jgi:hypothetical protein
MSKGLVMTGTRSAAVVALGLALCAVPAQAQEWEGRITPYIWASGLDGEASVLPSLPTVEVDDSFSDVLDNLDIALMAAVEADNGKLYLRSDVFYASLTTEGETPLNLYSGAEVNTKSFNISASAGYVLFKEGGSQFNVFGGLRLWSLDNKLTFLPGTLPGTSFSADRTFVNPIVGASGEFALGKSISAQVSGSVGGFGIGGTHIEHGMTANLNAYLGGGWGASAGYRYAYLDYEKNGFVYDVTQHGPFVGVFFDF